MHSSIATLRRRLCALPSTLSRSISLGLSLMILSVCVLLFLDLFSLRGNTRDSTAESRKIVAETLAMQLSTLASIGDTAGAEYAVSSFVNRNDGVEAAALTRDDGFVLGRHGDPALLDKVTATSTLNHLNVPIFSDGRPWGDVRIVFRSSTDTQRYVIWLAAAALALFAFFALFLSRVLVQLDPGRAVPGRVDSAMNLFSAGVVVLDGHGHIVMANRAAAKLAERTVGELTGRTLDEWAWQTDKGWQAPWTTTRHSGIALSDEPLRLRTPDGESRLLSVSCAFVGEESTKLQGVLVTLDDLTPVERKNHELADALKALRRTQEEISEKNRELKLLATTDPLTGIANRRTLMERLASDFERAQREGTALACIMSDIDHFKKVNDTYGHGVGDDVIKLVGSTFEQICREHDTIGRYGGEEFVMVLPGFDAAAAAEVAERVRIAVMALANGDLLAVPKLSSSFGVADIECGAEDGAALVDAADQALYAAKEGGRNRVVIRGEEELPAKTSADKVEVDKANKGSAEKDAGRDASIETGREREDELRARVVELETTLRNRDHELAALREFDSLTGMPTRALFLQRVQTELIRADRLGHAVGVMSIELRELGRIVSGFGHETAKALVTSFVGRLQEGLRSTDLVVTIAGEQFLSRITVNEFGVLLSDLSEPANALIVVSRLKRLLLRPFEIGEERIYVGVNIGISLSGVVGGVAAELVEQAGEARARAAAKPDKVSHSFASIELDRQSHEYLRLEADLHDALDSDALETWFQPKLDLATRRVTGMEALLRWRHESRGFVSPAVFVAVAEANGLIERLSTQVLERTLDQIRLWREMGFDELCVSVNLSPMQLHTESLVEETLAVLERKGVEGRQLEIELTETSVLDRPEEARVALGALRQAGVKISMDDFGTGYTSLALLADLPLDALKIDRSFVARMAEGERHRAIVKSIVAMARALRLRVVGEGVETNEELELLAAFGCDVVQGYLISHPRPAEDITAFLVQQRAAERVRRA